MIRGGRVLGLIAARGGSKGLPGKNTKMLLGRPLIAWTIAAARDAASLDEIVVSTDSAEIADIARACGAEVPFMRPAELASDTATSVSVVHHAIDWLARAGRTFDYVVLLEPTSPLREAADIDAALSLMTAADATAVVSICRTEAAHPSFLFKRAAAGLLTPFLPGPVKRRQEIDDLYFVEGSVYGSSVATLRSEGGFVQQRTVGFEVPKWKAIEIDDEIDWIVAEAIMRHRGLGP
jgi:N-acylneuraminate cytidylyltransferase/CMP-N,N'-diacetyllegionaminic acid synthase